MVGRGLLLVLVGLLAAHAAAECGREEIMSSHTVVIKLPEGRLPTVEIKTDGSLAMNASRVVITGGSGLVAALAGEMLSATVKLIPIDITSWGENSTGTDPSGDGEASGCTKSRLPTLLLPFASLLAIAAVANPNKWTGSAILIVACLIGGSVGSDAACSDHIEIQVHPDNLYSHPIYFMTEPLSVKCPAGDAVHKQQLVDDTLALEAYRCDGACPADKSSTYTQVYKSAANDASCAEVVPEEVKVFYEGSENGRKLKLADGEMANVQENNDYSCGPSKPFDRFMLKDYKLGAAGEALDISFNGRFAFDKNMQLVPISATTEGGKRCNFAYKCTGGCCLGEKTQNPEFTCAEVTQEPNDVCAEMSSANQTNYTGFDNGVACNNPRDMCAKSPVCTKWCPGGDCASPRQCSATDSSDNLCNATIGDCGCVAQCTDVTVCAGPMGAHPTLCTLLAAVVVMAGLRL